MSTPANRQAKTVSPMSWMAAMLASEVEVLGEGWVKWSGGKMPVPRNTLVKYRTRNGEGGTEYARDLFWLHGDPEGDIVAYCIVKDAK